MMKELTSMTAEELALAAAEAGEPPYRAKQLTEWIHQKGAVSLNEMKNLPKEFRRKLAESYTLAAPEIRDLQVSGLDGTRKYLFRFADGAAVESVRMSYHHGHTVCVSSQVGCRMGCTFCASAIGGLVRNLTAGEILSQVYAIGRETGERVSNVVIMGTGEPLDNYDQVIRFIRILTAPYGLNLSERSVTLSTCGLVPGIRRLKDENLAVSLALSLHAPDDELRRKLMPVAKAYPLQEILAAMREYYAANHRRLTFEYSLIRGTNDTAACADRLAALLKGMNCLVNLIPVNPVRETSYKATGRQGAEAFKKKLENHGIHVTIRREMGRDIDGACGQLRRRAITMDEYL